LFVLIAVLVASCQSGYVQNVTVHGELTCPYPFSYRLLLCVSLFFKHFYIFQLQSRTSVGKTAKYSISGKFELSSHDREIEPRLVIEHTCGGVFKCVCKDFDHTENDMNVKFDLDLKNNDL
ncbi:hypothetical protein PMAYCL1PPCAC_26413, partial [Pristionchus mayeri]